MVPYCIYEVYVSTITHRRLRPLTDGTGVRKSPPVQLNLHQPAGAALSRPCRFEPPDYIKVADLPEPPKLYWVTDLREPPLSR